MGFKLGLGNSDIGIRSFGAGIRIVSGPQCIFSSGDPKFCKNDAGKKTRAPKITFYLKNDIFWPGVGGPPFGTKNSRNMRFRKAGAHKMTKNVGNTS